MSKVSYEVQIKTFSTGHRAAYYNGMKIPSAPPPKHFKDGDTAILSCNITIDDQLGPRFLGQWRWKLVS